MLTRDEHFVENEHFVQFEIETLNIIFDQMKMKKRELPY